MSTFALAHELPLSPLQIHENLVLNPAFCYMRVPGSPSPFLTKVCSCHSWAGVQPSTARCPGWGGQVWVLIFHMQASLAWDPPKSLTAHSLSCFSSYFWSCQFSSYMFTLINSLLLELSDFVIIPASTKLKFSAVQMRHIKE